MGYRPNGSCLSANSMWDQHNSMAADPTYTHLTRDTFQVSTIGFPSPCPTPITNYAQYISYGDIWTIDENQRLVHVSEQ
jgi:hypothetical protein